MTMDTPADETPPCPVFGSLNELTKLLQDLDDRGLVLSLAAFAEDALGALLREFMAPVEATKHLLEGFNAPLGTFSSRIKACLALGLISNEQYRDLEHLRKIRNEFAHHWRPVDLSSTSVAGHVAGLSYGTLTSHFPETPAEKVRDSFTSLLMSIRSHTRQIREKKWSVVVRDPSLIAGFVSAPFDEQLKSAEAELDSLCAAKDATSGEKRRFYEMLLRRFETRVWLLHHTCPPESRQAFAAFQSAVTRATAGLSP